MILVPLREYDEEKEISTRPMGPMREKPEL